MAQHRTTKAPRRKTAIKVRTTNNFKLGARLFDRRIYVTRQGWSSYDKFREACIRCPVLRPDPAQEPRLLAIVVNLNDRLREATERGWLGEVDGLRVSLDAANQKLAQMRKIRGQLPLIQLGQTRRIPQR